MENTFNIELPCRLSQPEIQESIKMLGDLSNETVAINEQEKTYQAEIFKLRTLNKDAMAKLNKEIAKGIGIRPVACFKRPNVEKGIIEIVRKDTNRVVDKEPISKEQREAAAPTIPGLEASQETQGATEVTAQESQPA